MLPTIPSERSALISVPSLSTAANLPIVILVFLSLVTIRISYIMITSNDLVTLGRLLGILANLPIVILVFLSRVKIRISYIMITSSDHVTLGRLLGIFMVILFEDEMVVQALQVAMVVVLVLIIL